MERIQYTKPKQLHFVLCFSYFRMYVWVSSWCRSRYFYGRVGEYIVQTVLCVLILQFTRSVAPKRTFRIRAANIHMYPWLRLNRYNVVTNGPAHIHAIIAIFISSISHFYVSIIYLIFAVVAVTVVSTADCYKNTASFSFFSVDIRADDILCFAFTAPLTATTENEEDNVMCCMFLSVATHRCE